MNVMVGVVTHFIGDSHLDSLFHKDKVLGCGYHVVLPTGYIPVQIVMNNPIRNLFVWRNNEYTDRQKLLEICS